MAGVSFNGNENEWRKNGLRIRCGQWKGANKATPHVIGNRSFFFCCRLLCFQLAFELSFSLCKLWRSQKITDFFKFHRVLSLTVKFCWRKLKKCAIYLSFFTRNKKIVALLSFIIYKKFANLLKFAKTFEFKFEF